MNSTLPERTTHIETCLVFNRIIQMKSFLVGPQNHLRFSSRHHCLFPELNDALSVMQSCHSGLEFRVSRLKDILSGLVQDLLVRVSKALSPEDFLSFNQITIIFNIPPLDNFICPAISFDVSPQCPQHVHL